MGTPHIDFDVLVAAVRMPGLGAGLSAQTFAFCAGIPNGDRSWSAGVTEVPEDRLSLDAMAALRGILMTPPKAQVRLTVADSRIEELLDGPVDDEKFSVQKALVTALQDAVRSRSVTIEVAGPHETPRLDELARMAEQAGRRPGQTYADLFASVTVPVAEYVESFPPRSVLRSA